ncbi:MAG: rhodanese-like domain-containing protein [Gammaproteobacteria bacterium]|nr:rhodanese-like domain-containing protein [Gammaproteobacteria bacterium]
MKKQVVTFVVMLLGFSLLSACSNESQLKAWQMINEGALLVDVRTPGEFRSGHVPGAKLIPVNQLSQRLSEFGADKNRPIVVYCRSGSRSGKAQSILRAAGFSNVHNGGGFDALMSARKNPV